MDSTACGSPFSVFSFFGVHRGCTRSGTPNRELQTSSISVKHTSYIQLHTSKHWTDAQIRRHLDTRLYGSITPPKMRTWNGIQRAMYLPSFLIPSAHLRPLNYECGRKRRLSSRPTHRLKQVPGRHLKVWPCPSLFTHQ